MKMETQELITLASRILGGESDALTLTDMIVSYSGAFERWMKENEKFLSSTVAPTDKRRAELEELLEVHAKVLDKAQTLQGDTDKALKTLRSRGKGVLKYLDHFPKRVSISEGSKG